MGNAVSDGRVYGVFGDIAFNTIIVIGTAILSQWTALNFHLVGGLPGSDNHFTDSAHSLRV